MSVCVCVCLDIKRHSPYDPNQHLYNPKYLSRALRGSDLICLFVGIIYIFLSVGLVLVYIYMMGFDDLLLSVCVCVAVASQFFFFKQIYRPETCHRITTRQHNIHLDRLCTSCVRSVWASHSSKPYYSRISHGYSTQ